MRQLGKAAFVGLGLGLFLLVSAPAAHACCRPCAGYCGQPGVPPTASCCSGVSVPGNACGFTTCGQWLGGQATAVPADAEAASLWAGLAAIFTGTESVPSCIPS